MADDSSPGDAPAFAGGGRFRRQTPAAVSAKKPGTLESAATRGRKTRRYAALDGMRGVAAIAVVMFHAGTNFGVLRPDSAYLAVDFFFVLSDFVLAHAYEGRLASGMSALTFMRARMLRLYPLYLAGTLLTICAVLFALFGTRDAAHWTMSALAVSAPFAFFMLPSPVADNIFPLNFPGWSLFYEMLVNAAYATRTLFVGRAGLPIVIVASALGIVIQAVEFGRIDQGSLWSSTLWGAARVFYSFPVGVVVYRLHRAVRPRAASAAALACILTALMFVSVTGAERMVFGVAFVLLVSPVLVFAGAGALPRGEALNRVLQVLGAVSYPLYALHYPVIMVLNAWVHRHVRDLPLASWTPWLGFGFLAVLIGASWVAGELDVKLRRCRKRMIPTARGTGAQRIFKF